MPAAWAGSDVGGAPVKARFSTQSTATVRQGDSFGVRLAATATQNIAQGKVSFYTDGCASQIKPTTKFIEFDLPKNQAQTFNATFNLKTNSPCDVIAEILTYEGTNARIASVYGLTINAVSHAPLPGSRTGRTADGQKTIEVPAASN
jgi:hypothetical protein